MNTTEALYAAFAKYPHPRSMDGCPCCTSPEQSARLLAIPLNQVPSERLERYAFKATTTWGSLDQYRFFLPRILELSRKGELLCDVEVTLAKLAYNGFPSWSVDEQSAMIAYLHDWLQESVSEPHLGCFDSIICGAAQITDIEPFLQAADRFDNAIAARYQVNFARSDKRRLTNSFWERGNANYEKVLRWTYEDGESG